MTKYLYKIWQDANTDYDTYNSAVVCATSEAEAKNIHPSNESVWGEDGWVYKSGGYYYFDNWTEPQGVQVEKIGKADKNIQPGVIVASFNAG